MQKSQEENILKDAIVESEDWLSLTVEMNCFGRVKGMKMSGESNWGLVWGYELPQGISFSDLNELVKFLSFINWLFDHHLDWYFIQAFLS